MKHSVFRQIWRISYPILIHFVTGLAMVLVIRTALFNTMSMEEIVNLINSRAVEMNIVKSLIVIPIFWILFRLDRSQRKGDKAKNMTVKELAIVLVMAFCGNIAFNNLIALSGLARVSGNFQDVQSALYHSSLMMELIGSAFLVPVAEEMLFRGLVYKRLKDYYGIRAGAVFSALLFGVYHGNVVQGIYAFILGLVFVYMLEECKSMMAPIAAHMAANALSVLAVEVGLLSVQYQNMQIFLGFTTVSLALLLVFGFLLHSMS